MLLCSGRNDPAGFVHEESACTAGPNINPKKADNASYCVECSRSLRDLSRLCGSKNLTPGPMTEIKSKNRGTAEYANEGSQTTQS